jgi:hypothetical protein
MDDLLSCSAEYRRDPKERKREEAEAVLEDFKERNEGQPMQFASADGETIDVNLNEFFF